MKHSLRFVAIAAALVVVRTTASAQQSAGRGQFVITKGTDTVAVELFTRTASSLTSEIYVKNGPRTQYTIDLRPDSSMSHVELTRVGQNNQSMGVSVFFLDSIVKAQISANGEAEQLEFPSRRAVPILVVSFALCEQIVRVAHLAPGKSTTFNAVRLAAGDTTMLTLTRFHPDSVSFAMQGAQLKAALNGKGDVVGGVHLGQGWTITRKPGS